MSLLATFADYKSTLSSTGTTRAMFSVDRLMAPPPSSSGTSHRPPIPSVALPSAASGVVSEPTTDTAIVVVLELGIAAAAAVAGPVTLSSCPLSARGGQRCVLCFKGFEQGFRSGFRFYANK